jgi:hypothetical protein
MKVEVARDNAKWWALFAISDVEPSSSATRKLVTINVRHFLSS